MFENGSRRGFIKKVAYTAPIIATVAVVPAVASSGSPCDPRKHSHHDSKTSHRSRSYGKFKKVAKSHSKSRKYGKSKGHS